MFHWVKNKDRADDNDEYKLSADNFIPSKLQITIANWHLKLPGNYDQLSKYELAKINFYANSARKHLFHNNLLYDIDLALDPEIKISYLASDPRFDSYLYWNEDLDQLEIVVNKEQKEPAKNYQHYWVIYELGQLLLRLDMNTALTQGLKKACFSVINAKDNPYGRRDCGEPKFIDANSKKLLSAYPDQQLKRDQWAMAFANTLLMPDQDVYELIKEWQKDKVISGNVHELIKAGTWMFQVPEEVVWPRLRLFSASYRKNILDLAD